MDCAVYDCYCRVALIIEHLNFLSNFRCKKPMGLGFTFFFIGISQ